jgi:hypothetical protein
MLMVAPVLLMAYFVNATVRKGASVRIPAGEFGLDRMSVRKGNQRFF